jgi:hypothetical protein
MNAAVEIWDVEHRPCKQCKHFKTLPAGNGTICEKKSMGVTPGMHVTYRRDLGSCFEIKLLPRREDAVMDEDGHCTVCGCELREYHGGTDQEAIAEHICPPGFRIVDAGVSGG